MGIPHLRYPFRITTSGVADTVEQDTVEEIAQCVQTVLTTTEGERIELPQFGVPGFLFDSANQIDSDILVRRINQFEPRAQVALDIRMDTVDVLMQRITAYVSAASAHPVGANANPGTSIGPGDGFGLGGYGTEPWGS